MMSFDVELKPIFLDEIYFFIDFIQSKNQIFKSDSYTFGSIIMKDDWYCVFCSIMDGIQPFFYVKVD